MSLPRRHFLHSGLLFDLDLGLLDRRQHLFLLLVLLLHVYCLLRTKAAQLVDVTAHLLLESDHCCLFLSFEAFFLFSQISLVDCFEPTLNLSFALLHFLLKLTFDLLLEVLLVLLLQR